MNKQLLVLSVLTMLGVVGFIALADNIACHLLPTDVKTCQGTPRNDVITYISGFNTQATTIAGGAGNDRISIDFRLTKVLTMIDGEEDNDTIFDSSAANPLRGGPGNDRIFGNEGNDNIDGGPGNDLINGGVSSISGPNGQVSGGGGNDAFILKRGDAGGGTEKIMCTIDGRDRSVLRLVGFSKVDLSGQGLRRGALPPNTRIEIRDGTGKFEIDTGQGICLLAF